MSSNDITSESQITNTVREAINGFLHQPFHYMNSLRWLGEHLPQETVDRLREVFVEEGLFDKSHNE